MRLAMFAIGCVWLVACFPPAVEPPEEVWPPPPGDVCASAPGSLARPRPVPAPAAPKTGPLELDEPSGPAPPAPSGPPPVAGQMTEAAGQAKRLFDGEKWALAERALGDVASGRTGDDEGNRQLAEYHLAIAVFRQLRYPEAAERFRVIAEKPSHLKWNETLLWLVKLAREDRTLVRISDLAAYGEEPEKFNNANQRVVYGALRYLVGRVRYDEGKLADAERSFAIAATLEPWSQQAKHCLARVKQLRGR